MVNNTKAIDKYLISSFELEIYNNWLSKMEWEDNEYSYKCFLLDVFNLNAYIKDLDSFYIAKIPFNNTYYGFKHSDYTRVMYILNSNLEIYSHFKNALLRLKNILDDK